MEDVTVFRIWMKQNNRWYVDSFGQTVWVTRKESEKIALQAPDNFEIHEFGLVSVEGFSEANAEQASSRLERL